jgi:glycosyltransferase involved in cell wall biosynthesis
MRILYVIGTLEIGGAELHVVRLAKELKLQGYSPELFVLEKKGPLLQTLEQSDIPVFSPPVLNYSSCFAPLKRLGQIIKIFTAIVSVMFYMLRRRPDVSHFFLPGAYLVGGFAAVATNTRPLVMSRRSLNRYQYSHRLYFLCERWLHQFMAAICGNSKAVISELEGEGVKKEKLHLIYNGFDPNQFKNLRKPAVVRSELGIQDDAIIFIVVANLIPYKGHKDLLNAFSEIKEKLPNEWTCLFVGRDDGIGNDLRIYANLLGLSSHFHFLGSRVDIPDLLCASDVGVLCSHEEGFSNAVLEGMAASLPMVVSDVGGNSEAVKNGVNGIVVPPSNPNLLGAALLSLALDSDLRKKMGQSGYSMVIENFSSKSTISKYTSLYKTLKLKNR